MKYFILGALLLLSGVTYSQDGKLLLDANKKATYTDQASTQKSKDECFKIAQKWISDTFGNYENAVVKQDAATGLLVINTYTPVQTSLYDYVRFDLTLTLRDQGYQVKITNLDGTSQLRSPARLGINENNLVTEKEMLVKTETNKKKRSDVQQQLDQAKADNDHVNEAMFKVLASLKEYIASH
ncbi:DUF4468 domain-containing protein [Dyadobacter luteus]|uniref:DUF4468 domain-containing protein n=1 Tax=Dyadobacter luteus TaxID=2259619 RepID=UPI001314432C|nr:DUF4468 domain-containing protein [Dyadobacter luteus]